MCPPACRRSRRGTIAWEALLVVPVLAAFLLAAVQMGMLLAAEQRLAEASGQAARVRALGGTDAQMNEAVRRVLGDARYAAATVRYNDCDHRVPQGELVLVRVELPTAAAAPVVFDLVGSTFLGETLVGQTAMPKE
jgi:Flp pilus assembly protein TadG